MNKKTWIMGFGSVLSIVLLAVMLYGLDWAVFRRTLMSLSAPIVLAVCAVIAVNYAVRAVRWLLIGDAPLRLFSSYWQAAIIGHLGNLIYPLRAGELIRVVALKHFTGSPLGQVVTSAFIDRLSDVIMLGFLVLVVGAIHGEAVLGQDVVSLILVVVIVGLLVILLLLYFSPRLYAVATSRDGGTGFGGRARLFLIHLFVGFMKLRGARRLALIAAVSVAVFCLECFARFGLMKAFGWDLPIEAAMTLVAFLYVGVSVPSWSLPQQGHDARGMNCVWSGVRPDFPGLPQPVLFLRLFFLFVFFFWRFVAGFGLPSLSCLPVSSRSVG